MALEWDFLGIGDRDFSFWTRSKNPREFEIGDLRSGIRDAQRSPVKNPRSQRINYNCIKMKNFMSHRDNQIQIVSAYLRLSIMLSLKKIRTLAVMLSDTPNFSITGTAVAAIHALKILYIFLGSTLL